MSRLPVLLLFLPLIGCSSEPAAPAASHPLTPQFTPASPGVIPNPLGQATFNIEKVKRVSGADWHFILNAKNGFELAVRQFTYAPGSYTGWHTHPGPVFIQVREGTVTFYEADDPDCTPIVVNAGESYLDLGDHPHIGRNESPTVTARDLVVLFAPPGTTNFRNDAPAPPPGQCPFEN